MLHLRFSRASRAILSSFVYVFILSQQGQASPQAAARSPGPAAGRLPALNSKLQLAPEGSIIKVDTDIPVQVIYNNKSPHLGQTAITWTDAYAYKGDYDSGYAFFLNMLPTTGPYFPGEMIADDFIIGNGFDASADQISAYELVIFRSPDDPLDGLTPATYHFELWDGDPFCEVWTPAGGYACAKIAGTECTWSDVPGSMLGLLRCDLPAPVSIPHREIFGVLYGEDTCRTGWRISGKLPQIGSIIMEDDPPLGIDLFEMQSDYYGEFDRSCCRDLGPCSSGPCAEPGNRSFCTDLDAESAFLSTFGGPCTGSEDDFCSNFVFNAYAPTDFTVTLTPKPKSGATVVGNEIILPAGGQPVWFDIMFENWVIPVQTLNARIDPSGYSNGLGGTLTPYNPPCTSNADCEAMLGVGSDCNDPYYPPGGCAPGFMGWKGDDILNLGINAVNIWTLYFTYGSTCLGCGLGAPDPGGPHTAGQLVLWVPETAKGTYTIGFVTEDTWMRSGGWSLIPLLAQIPGKVTIEVGQCCDVTVPPGTCIDDQLTWAECTALNGKFNKDRTCDDTCGCVSEAECNDDGDACTDAVCDAGLCSHVDNFDGSTYCCDPATGTLCPIDDGNICTEDGCERADSRGDCVHIQPDPDCSPAVPATSTWGLVVLGLCLLAGARLYFRRRRTATT